jgi:hypothetical protein
MPALKPWASAALRNIYQRLPELRVGDVWCEIPNDGNRIQIERVEDEEGAPFPMVFYKRLDDGEVDLDPRMGAPMFLFGQLVTRGTGAAWSPRR